MLHLTILVTNECNLSCRYCFSIANVCRRKEMLTVENAIKMVRNIDVPVSSISLSGGEPFLHAKLNQLYALFKQKYPTWITTNGTIAPHDSLVSGKGLYVTVSLNAINQDIDHLLRGTHCKVETILKNIQILSTISDRFKVNTIVSSVNKDDVYSIGSFLTRLNVRNNPIWNLLQVTINSNVVAECSDLLITNHEFRETVSNLQEMFGDNICINASTSEELERNCYMVSPSGEVFNLEKWNRPIGNVLENKLGCII